MTTIYSGINLISGGSSSGSGTELTPQQIAYINDVPNKASKSYTDEELLKKAEKIHTHEITDVNSLSNELNNRYTKAETLSTTEIRSLISTLALGTTWKDPVATKTDLDSLIGSVSGDTRIVQDTNVICVYDGTKWVEIGSASVVNLATSTLDGLMSKEDKAKLDSIIINDLITKTDLSTTLTDYAKKTDLDSYLKPSNIIAGDNIILDVVDNNITIKATASGGVGVINYATEDDILALFN